MKRLIAFLVLVATPALAAPLPIRAFGGVQMLGQASSPFASGKSGIYINSTDGLVHYVTSGGVDSAVGSGGGGYATIAQAGSSLAARTKLNFTGAFSCADNSGSTRTDCDLASVGPVGSYTAANVTIDAYGRVTAAANGGSAGFAAPTGKATTTATAGSATTAIRSDANIALDLTVSPTWTGSHSFTGTTFSATPTGALTLTAGAASTWKTSAGNLTIDSASAISLGTSTANNINVGNMAGSVGILAAGVSIQGGSSGSTIGLSTSGINMTAVGASNWKTTTGALNIDAATALNLGTSTATALNVGGSAAVVSITGSTAHINGTSLLYVGDASPTSHVGQNYGNVFVDGAAKITEGLEINRYAISADYTTGGYNHLIAVTACTSNARSVTLNSSSDSARVQHFVVKNEGIASCSITVHPPTGFTLDGVAASTGIVQTGTYSVGRYYCNAASTCFTE